MMTSRVEWVDTAKGICIIFVVMMHSVLGVEAAAGQTGWMHSVVVFAAPFRMPDFFLISGLFLSNVIARDWKLYLDRKVIHFAYFYILWMTIQFMFKAPFFAAEDGWTAVPGLYLFGFVQPFGTLWFIYLLPMFFVISKVAHDKGLPWQIVLGVAVLLHIAPIHTGSLIVDEFASRFVFFYAGYVFAPKIFQLADWASSKVAPSLAILTVWALVNGSFVALGWSGLPIVSLVLGGAGAIAIILTSSLLAQIGQLRFLPYFGANSIVIYLAFFFPMSVMRIVLLKLGFLDIGTVSLVVTTVSVISPIILLWLIKKTNLGWFLFKRPGWAYLKGTFSSANVRQTAG